MKIIVGADGFGSALKDSVISHLEAAGHEVEDVGTRHENDERDYPDVALDVAHRVARGDADRGVLVCGTGIGMAMVANKVPGVRAACCHDPYSAERARMSNDAQVITFGAQIIGPALACSLLDHWLPAEFAGGRSQRKVDKIKALDARLAAGLEALPSTESPA